jgi:hypothetical protein
MATATKNAARKAAKALHARKAVKAQTVANDSKRMDLTDLQKKYRKIEFVTGTLRFVTNPQSHFHNKQVVDVVCKDNGKTRTLATSDLQHYKAGALSEEGARQRRLERIRARRKAAAATA